MVPPPLPSLEKTPWNAWWTLFWAVILFLVWQIVMGMGLGIALFINDASFLELAPAEIAGDFQAMAGDGDVVGLIAFVTIFFVCPACWLIARLRPGWSGWEYLGNSKTKWWHWPLWGAAILLCTFVFSGIAPYLGIDEPDESMVAMGKSTQYPILLFLGVAIGAPLIEEFIFRGILWRGWRASWMGLLGTLLLTSFFWAVLHVQYPPIIIAYIFCLGIVLGLAREITGNVWIPIWMHALNNGLATLSMLTLAD